MKITKRGSPPAERVWTGVCSTCGSEAEAFQSELEEIARKSDVKDPESYHYVLCPVCGQQTMQFLPKQLTDFNSGYFSR